LLGTAPWLDNFATLLMALLALHCTMRLLEDVGCERAWLAGVIVAAHPVFLANSTVAMDYAWGLGLVMSGALQLSRGHALAAGALFGLAVTARFTSVLPAAAFLAVRFLQRPDERARLLLSGSLMGAIIAVGFFPAFAYHDYTLALLKAQYDPWSVKGHALRLAYRFVYFWGLPAFAVLSAIAVLTALRGREPRASRPDARFLTYASLAAIALGLAMFARYPIESAYLLVILPFVAIVLVQSDVGRPWWAPALVACLVSFAFVNVNVARVPVKGSDRPELGVWIEPGYLVKAVRERVRFMGARSLEDWSRITRMTIP
jgi:hypothetical protein